MKNKIINKSMQL